MRALSAVVEVSNRSALILGAGGAARAVAYGLKRAGAAVTISNRCIERGGTLAKEHKSEFIPLNMLGETAVNFDIVVQCTSVGLKDRAEASPIAFDTFFRPEMTVMDIIYSPPCTAFLKAAGNAGCTVVPGLEMLLYQGAAQLEWWLERPVFQTPAIAAMRRALLAAAEGEWRTWLAVPPPGRSRKMKFSKAIKPVSNINGKIQLPGSKSITHRALIMAALATGPGQIGNPLRAEDTLLTGKALEALGATMNGAPIRFG